MTATVLPFQPKPKLAPGERPKRRTDAERVALLDGDGGTILNADRLADLDRQEANGPVQSVDMIPYPGWQITVVDGVAHHHLPGSGPNDLLAHAKEGEPKGVA